MMSEKGIAAATTNLLGSDKRFDEEQNSL